MDNSDEDRARQEAAQWCARLRAPDVRPEELAAFEQWLGSDPHHAAVYAAAERLNESLAALAAKDPRLKALVDQAASAGATIPDDPPEDEWNPQRPLTASATPSIGRGRRRLLRRGLWAAGIVVAIASSLLIVEPTQRLDASALSSVGIRDEIRYSAGSARRAVTLEDGTRVYLDVASGIAVNYSGARRGVTLIQGRALFDVAHDKQRPFVVAAGTDRVTALGTVFQVDRQTAEIVVTLAQGAVTVDTQGSPTAPVQLAPGEELRMPTDQTHWIKRPVDALSATSWSLGKHIFREQPLEDVVREINRYANTKVHLADPALGLLAVTGEFATGDSAAIVEALTAALPLRTAMVRNGFLIYRDDPR
jgi:transmembrane sensor